MLWLPGVALCEVAGELEPEAEPLVLWLVEPPEAEPDFFSGSLGVDVEDELEPDDGVLGVAEDEELDEDGELGGVADDEDEEPDGVVTLPPPEALPEAEPDPDGVLGVVAEDDDEPEPAGPVVRWVSLSPQAARPRAIATEIARVESLMSPPWLGSSRVSSSLRARSERYSRVQALRTAGVSKTIGFRFLVAPVENAYWTSKERTAMANFRKVILYTAPDGRARWREEDIALGEGTPQARLSALLPSSGYQLRESPVGFRSEFHCTPKPQWVFILAGEMEIGLQDGSTRVFRPGEHFYSADVLPDGASFDPKLHGHWSRQRGDQPLVTLFVKS